jgi:glyoxylase-like metal-dependent hydrolase (beta-lactamase superfamily II)
MDLLFTYGHTDAMMLPVLSYKGKKILYTADLIPSVGHLPLPYVMGYDVRPLETLKEKERILTKAAQEDWLLFFEHDAANEMCSLEMTEKGVRKKEYGAFSHFL